MISAIWIENIREVEIPVTGTDTTVKKVITETVPLYGAAEHFPGVFTYDREAAEKNVTDVELTEEIVDRCFVGTLKFTLKRNHPGYDKIYLYRSTVYAKDDNRRVFRGRAVEALPGPYRQRAYTCENDIKFLNDVPDIFSTRTKTGVEYKLGSEDGYTGLMMATYNEVQNFYQLDKWYNYYGSRRGTYSYDYQESEEVPEIRQVYRSVVRGQLVPRSTGKVYEESAPSSWTLAVHMWDNWHFDRGEVGKTFDVEIQNALDTNDTNGPRVYQAKLRKYSYTVQNQENVLNPYMERQIDVLYLGNLLLALNPKDIRSPTGGAPSEIEIGQNDAPDQEMIGTEYYDCKPGTERDLEAEHPTAGEVNWCIAHFIVDRKIRDPESAKMYEESIFYTVAPMQAQNAHPVAVRCKLIEKTTVNQMFRSIFREYGQTGGYNLYADPGREIYRGDNQTSGRLPLTETDGSCRDNLKKMLEAGAGYAKISYKKVPEHPEIWGYVLDLLADTGEKDYSMKMKLGENVIDCSGRDACAELKTAIYPVGIGNNDDERYALTGRFDEEAAGGISTTGLNDVTFAPIEPTERFPIDAARNMIYNTEAKKQYGLAVAYREYQVGDVHESMRLQNLYGQALEDLKELLTAETSIEISAADPRLINRGGRGPVLGNYYEVDVPFLQEPVWLPLTKITTKLAQPGASRLTFGKNEKKLSDYAAKKKE